MESKSEFSKSKYCYTDEECQTILNEIKKINEEKKLHDNKPLKTKVYLTKDDLIEIDKKAELLKEAKENGVMLSLKSSMFLIRYNKLDMFIKIRKHGLNPDERPPTIRRLFMILKYKGFLENALVKDNQDNQVIITNFQKCDEPVYPNIIYPQNVYNCYSLFERNYLYSIDNVISSLGLQSQWKRDDDDREKAEQKEEEKQIKMFKQRKILYNELNKERSNIKYWM